MRVSAAAAPLLPIIILGASAGCEAAGCEAFEALAFHTYRARFFLAPSSTPISDAAWGCTLRALQSLLANALALNASVFCDAASPAGGCGLLSLSALLSHSKKAPGSWWGVHESCFLGVSAAQSTPLSLSLLLQPDGVVADDEVRAALASLAGSGVGGPLVVLLPLRLGADRVGAASDALLRALALRASCGAIAGPPGHACFVAGLEGDRLLCLDPHVVASRASLLRPCWASRSTLLPSSLDGCVALAFRFTDVAAYERWRAEFAPLRLASILAKRPWADEDAVTALSPRASREDAFSPLLWWRRLVGSLWWRLWA
jgi:hypothetical protein